MMSKFEIMVSELNEFPKIETYCVKDDNNEPLLVNGKAIMVETLKSVGATKTDAETLLMDQVREMIKGKKVWIRVMPYVTNQFDHDVWSGRARIAVL